MNNAVVDRLIELIRHFRNEKKTRSSLLSGAQTPGIVTGQRENGQ